MLCQQLLDFFSKAENSLNGFTHDCKFLNSTYFKRKIEKH